MQCKIIIALYIVVFTKLKYSLMKGVLYLGAPCHLLVCVTQQKTCERLIQKAELLRKEISGRLFVIHVAKSEWSFLDNKKEGEALEYLFGISKSIGADLAVLRSDDIVHTIVEFIKENKISIVVVGESPNDHTENNFIKELKRLVSHIEVQIIPPL